MIIFSEMKLRDLFAQGQIDSGMWVHIYGFCIVYVHINLQIDAQSLDPYVKLNLFYVNISDYVEFFVAELQLVGMMSSQAWPRAVFA